MSTALFGHPNYCLNRCLNHCPRKTDCPNHSRICNGGFRTSHPVPPVSADSQLSSCFLYPSRILQKNTGTKLGKENGVRSVRVQACSTFSLDGSRLIQEERACKGNKVYPSHMRSTVTSDCPLRVEYSTAELSLRALGRGRHANSRAFALTLKLPQFRVTPASTATSSLPWTSASPTLSSTAPR